MQVGSVFHGDGLPRGEKVDVQRFRVSATPARATRANLRVSPKSSPKSLPGLSSLVEFTSVLPHHCAELRALVRKMDLDKLARFTEIMDLGRDGECY